MCPSCIFVTVKSVDREESTGQTNETDSTTVTDSQSEQSLSGPREEVTIQGKGETVSEQHTTQGETSDQRTESPSPVTQAD